MSYKYDTAFFIGRFQIFHIGHLKVAQEALKHAKELVFIIGSSRRASNVKNPFRELYREHMIRETMKDLGLKNRVSFHFVEDYLYNDNLWIRDIQEIIRLHNKNYKKCIVGFSKDETSEYLRWFPEVDVLEIDPVRINEDGILGSTYIRNIYFDGYVDNLKPYLPKPVYDILRNYSRTEDYRRLCEEQQFLNTYKSAWQSAPYPPTFVTVDAVVVQSGHVLLITRGANPGKGLLALPGGFLGQRERILDACLRELYEETKIRVQEKVIKRYLFDCEVFDHPSRSLRGRTITHAYYFKLDDTENLPKVRGGDDAEKAGWYPISFLTNNPHLLFEDHWDIITYFYGRA